MDRIDIILGFAQIAASAAICIYAITLRGMLSGKMKDDQTENLNNMSSFYSELIDAYKGISKGEQWVKGE